MWGHIGQRTDPTHRTSAGPWDCTNNRGPGVCLGDWRAARKQKPQPHKTAQHNDSAPMQGTKGDIGRHRYYATCNKALQEILCCIKHTTDPMLKNTQPPGYQYNTMASFWATLQQSGLPPTGQPATNQAACNAGLVCSHGSEASPQRPHCTSGAEPADATPPAAANSFNAAAATELGMDGCRATVTAAAAAAVAAVVSRQVPVHLPVMLVALQELALDEVLNALLDVWGTCQEPAAQLLRDLHHH